jgi:hypothetical protein
MQSSRTTWLKIALALALAAVGLSSLSAAPVRGPAGKFEVEKWVTDDSDVIMVFNVRTMLDAPMVKKGGLPALKEALKNNEMAKDLLKATGIDPFKDVESILMSGSAKDAKDAKVYVVVRGNFDPDKVRAAAEGYAKKSPDDLKVTKSGDLYLYEITLNDRKMLGAFANKNTFVLTQDKASTEALVKDGGKKAGKLTKSLASAVGKFATKETMSLVVVATDEMKNKLGQVPQAKEIAPKLESVTASLVLTDEANLNLTVHTSDAASAKKTSRLLKSAQQLVSLFVLNNEDVPPIVGEMLEAIKISSDQSSVLVNLKVTQAMVDKAGKKE